MRTITENYRWGRRWREKSKLEFTFKVAFGIMPFWLRVAKPAFGYSKRKMDAIKSKNK